MRSNLTIQNWEHAYSLRQLDEKSLVEANNQPIHRDRVIQQSYMLSMRFLPPHPE